MATPPPIERLRLSYRSAVLAVAMLGMTLALLRLVSASQRVLGWMLAAAAAAGLLHPIVNRLERRMRRGLAVAVVFVGAILSVGVVGYGLVDSVVSEFRHLRVAAPARAAELEQEGRFAELARDFDLSERTERFLEEAPERLRGGTPAEAIRSAATRGVAYLATAVLTLFLLLHGRELAAAAALQIHDPDRRGRVERAAVAVFQRGFAYARGTIAMAALAGLVAYTVASAADVPGAAALGLWVALWDVVPLVGAAVGALPIVALAAAASPERAVALAAVFVAYQAVEYLVIQRWVERNSVRVGPFATVLAGFAGLELYGVGGALVTLLAVTLALTAVDELAPG